MFPASWVEFILPLKQTPEYMMSENQQTTFTPGSRTLLYAYVTLACLLSLFTVYLCYEIIWRGPFRDLWEFIGIIENQFHGHWQLNELIQPYGGIHRILIPKLLFYLDYRFANGSNLLALTVTLALHITACVIFLRSIYVSNTLASAERWLLGATVLLFFFSTTQIYNLIYISDNQVPISNAFALMAAWCFCRNFQYWQYSQHSQQPQHTHTLRYLIYANGFVLLACLSHSSGLMMLPAIFIAMFLLRYPKQQLIAQLFFVVATLLIYTSGSDPLQQGAQPALSLWEKIINALASTLINSVGIIKYIGLHLSSPTSRLWPGIGIALSYLSIIYLLSQCYRTWKQTTPASIGTVFWLTLALYVLLISLVTAYGRQMYPNSALTDRFQTLVMVYWPALLMLLYFDLKHFLPQRFLPPMIIPAAALLLLFPHQYNSARDMAWLSSRVHIAHTAAMTNITDIKTVAATLSHPLLMDNKNLVATHHDFLQQNRLGYFSYSLADLMGQPFNEGTLTTHNCSGKVSKITRITNQSSTTRPFRVNGQAAFDNRMLGGIVFIDATRMTVGLARSHRKKGDFMHSGLKRGESFPWRGFINLPANTVLPLTAYGKTPAGYCKLFTIEDGDIKQ